MAGESLWQGLPSVCLESYVGVTTDYNVIAICLLFDIILPAQQSHVAGLCKITNLSSLQCGVN